MALTLSGNSGNTTLDSSNGLTFSDSSNQQYAASPYGIKNRLINGSMAVDQRNNGSSVSIASGAGNVYTVDRWAGVTSGGTATYQRVAGPTGYQYAMQITGGSGVTQAQLFQRIEAANSYDLANKTVTVSFVASSTTITSLNVYVVYPTSGSDNWSGGYTSIATNTITINSTDTAYSTSFSLPSNVTNGMGLIFYTGSFTSGTLKITGVQLEVGSTATPFERRMYGQELALCQRYYYRATPSSGGIGQAGAAVFVAPNASEAMGNNAYPVTMRAAPTISFYDNAGTANSVHRFSIADTGATVNPVWVSNTAWLCVTKTTGWATGNVIGALWNASAEL